MSDTLGEPVDASRLIVLQQIDQQSGSIFRSPLSLAMIWPECALWLPDAGGQMAALPAHTRAEIRDGIELHLRNEPTKLSRSRVKRLRGLERPQYRLRVGEMGVFYDVTETEVQVLGRVRGGGDHSARTARWLAHRLRL